MYGYGNQFGKISGSGSPSAGAILAAAYKVRVEADSGTYENGGCLVSFLNSLQ